MISLKEIKEGLRLFYKSTKRRITGTRKFKGKAQDICKKIIEKCWNKKYLLNSLGNYRCFWARDFGISVEALMKLGYAKEAKATIKYAIEKYKQQGGITTTILPNGKLFNFPNIYSPDSTAFMLYAIKTAKAKDILKENWNFLQKEINKFFEETLDKKTGLVKKKSFSGMRDYAIRKGSCYDNTIMLWLSESAKELGFNAPKLSKTKFIKKFWTKNHFKNTFEEEHFAADSNIIPFWTGIVKDKRKLSKVIERIEKEGLNDPLPLRYTKYWREKHVLQELVVPAWERKTDWSNIGMMYLLILAKHDKKKARKEIKKYIKIVEKYGTMHECYFKGKPYQSILYLADEGMLWSANLAYVIKLLQKKK